MKKYNKQNQRKEVSNRSSLKGFLLYVKMSPEINSYIVDCKNEGGDLHRQVKNRTKL